MWRKAHAEEKALKRRVSELFDLAVGSGGMALRLDSARIGEVLFLPTVLRGLASSGALSLAVWRHWVLLRRILEMFASLEFYSRLVTLSNDGGDLLLGTWCGH